MPSTTSKNLGQVAAFVSGPTAPTNINLIWLDTSGPNTIKKVWDPLTNQWTNLFDAGTVTGDNWGTQVVVHDATLDGDGTTGVELKIAQQGATTGQVLKWNGTTWAPAPDDTGAGITTVTHGLELSGNGTVGVPLTFAQQGATNGQVLKWSTAQNRWIPGNDDVGVQYAPGMIMMWCGLTTAVPGGWTLCNGAGNLSTGQPVPDLRGRFIAGWSDLDPDYNVIGNTGGAKTVSLTASQNGSHTHSLYDPGHAHHITGTNQGNNSGSGQVPAASWTGNEDAGYTEAAPTGIAIQYSGAGDPHENRPPYYTLAYIVKL